MEIADAQNFLKDHHRACIAVRQKDGWPQMTFVTPGIDPQGRVIITSRGTTYKIKHIRHDPRVSMLIFGEQYSGSNSSRSTARQKSSSSRRPSTR